MAKVPLHTAIHDCRDAADRAAGWLDRLAFALDRVGMDKLSEELKQIAEMVVHGPREVNDAYNAHMTEQVHHSEAMMANLLKATMDGCIGPPKPAA